MPNPPSDSTRPPTIKEAERLTARLRRLGAPRFDQHLDALQSTLSSIGPTAGTLTSSGLKVRTEFSYLMTAIPGDSSDRKAPPRNVRPPAMRISSSRGSALPLMLTAMSLVQLHRKPGAKARLSDLGIEITGSTHRAGWADLVATLPPHTHGHVNFITSREKRARTVREALKTLQEAGLVSVPDPAGKRNRYEGFVLLNEAGAEALGEHVEYTAPTASDSAFAMPPGLILNNWLYVLEDSEIAVLLMIACGLGSWDDGGLSVFGGDVRLLHYGIHRDPYSAARKTLEWLGLINVHEVGRHRDGRAEDDVRRVHRVGLRAEGFEKPALATAQAKLSQQLKRI